MKKKIGIALALALVAILTLGSVALANDEESSTMYFEGELQEEDSGYGGTVYMTDDGVHEDGGFDVYAKDGASATFIDNRGLVGPTAVINNHDAWPTWDPDTPDWNCYALTLGGNSWKLVYNNAATPLEDWAVRGGVPMSGTMDWNTMYAAETDVGHCFGNPVDVGADNPGWAATNGGGPQAWDMDWLWGGEVVPLEYPGFTVSIVNSVNGGHQVVMVPAPVPSIRVHRKAQYITIRLPDAKLKVKRHGAMWYGDIDFNDGTWRIQIPAGVRIWDDECGAAHKLVVDENGNILPGVWFTHGEPIITRL